MREALVMIIGWLSALSFLWTFGSIYFVLQLELGPALDPMGIVRTIVLAPGYAAFWLGAGLAQLPVFGAWIALWMGAAIVAIAMASIPSLLVARLVMKS